jgi:ankyrin repeat protein
MAVVNTATAGYYGVRQEKSPMYKELLKAATSGDYTSMQAMASRDPNILVGTAPSGNTCLHISSIHGHERFCQGVAKLNEHLLTAVNMESETPLVVAVTNGHVSLALLLLRHCCQLGFRDAILQQDMLQYNVLHHAIRCGHKELALELIQAEPNLSQDVTRFNESAMFIAAMRDYTHVVKKLLNIPGSSHAGLLGRNALHAAVRLGHAGEINGVEITIILLFISS